MHPPKVKTIFILDGDWTQSVNKTSVHASFNFLSSRVSLVSASVEQ